MPDIAFVKPALPKNGVLVLPLAEGAALAGLAREAEEVTGGLFSRALEAAGFKGRKGQATTLWAVGNWTKVIAVGLGKDADIGAEAAEAAGGALAPALAQDREAVVAADALEPALAARIGFGLLLRAWRFDRYRTKQKEEEKQKLERVAISTASTTAAKTAFAPLRAIADGVFLTRELVSEPPNVLTPAEFADRCKGLERLGVEVEVLGPKEMKILGHGSSSLPRGSPLKDVHAPRGDAASMRCEGEDVLACYGGARREQPDGRRHTSRAMRARQL